MLQLTACMSTLIMWHNRFSENEIVVAVAHLPKHRYSKTKKRQYRDYRIKKARHRDLGTKTPRHRETETTKPQHRDSKAFFQRRKSHDIEIDRVSTEF